MLSSFVLVGRSDKLLLYRKHELFIVKESQARIDMRTYIQKSLEIHKLFRHTDKILLINN